MYFYGAEAGGKFGELSSLKKTCCQSSLILSLPAGVEEKRCAGKPDRLWDKCLLSCFKRKQLKARPAGLFLPLIGLQLAR